MVKEIFIEIEKRYRGGGMPSLKSLSKFYNDEFPKEIYKTRHPNLLEDELKYIKENYRNPIKADFGQALVVLKTIFNKNNFLINSNNEEVLEYFEKFKIFEFFKNIYLDGVIIEPESMLTFNIEIEEVEFTQSGNLVEQQRIPFKPYLVTPDKLLYTDKKNIAYKIKGNSDFNYVIISKENESIRYTQYNYNNSSKEKTNISLIFNIEAEFKRKADGDKKIIDNELEIFSYFERSVPTLKEIIFNSIDRSIIEARNNYPREWEYSNTCDVCSGSGTEGFCDNAEDCTECKKCKGTGHVNTSGILRKQLIPFPNALQENTVAPPFAGFVTPPIEPQRYLTERIKEDRKKAFDWLGIDNSSSDVKGSETALGKAIDREKQYAVLSSIASDIEYTMNWFLKNWSKLMFNVEDVIFVASKNQFRIVSVSQQNMEFTELLNANAPEYITRSILEDLYTEMQEVEKFKIIDKYYLYKPFPTIKEMVLLGMITRRAAIAHSNILNWIEQIDVENYEEEIETKIDEIIGQISI